MVVLQNSDLDNCETLFAQFEATCSNTFIGNDPKIPVSIACGFARFDPGKDQCWKDVFKRADENMYTDKRMVKAG